MYTYAIVALAAALAAGTGAWKVQAWRFDAAKLEAIEVQRETDTLRRKSANAASGQFETVRTKIRTEFVPIDREVERVKIQYRDRDCFDADGLRIIRDAIRATGNTGEPEKPVPTPTKPARGESGSRLTMGGANG